MSIAAPTVHRNWTERPVLNSAGMDYMTEEGVRLGLPLYVDLPTQKRKELLNGVRSACAAVTTSKPGQGSLSGISVAQSQSMQPQVEAFLGVSVDVLRTILVSRGGLQADLLFRLQAVTGITFVTEKDFAAAFKQRQTQVKDYIKSEKFDAEE